MKKHRKIQAADLEVSSAEQQNQENKEKEDPRKNKELRFLKTAFRCLTDKHVDL